VSQVENVRPPPLWRTPSSAISGSTSSTPLPNRAGAKIRGTASPKPPSRRGFRPPEAVLLSPVTSTSCTIPVRSFREYSTCYPTNLGVTRPIRLQLPRFPPCRSPKSTRSSPLYGRYRNLRPTPPYRAQEVCYPSTFPPFHSWFSYKNPSFFPESGHRPHFPSQRNNFLKPKI
jgi:hypothetical protein